MGEARMIFRFLCSAFGLLLVVVVVPPVTPISANGASDYATCYSYADARGDAQFQQFCTYFKRYCCGVCTARSCCEFKEQELNQDACLRTTGTTTVSVRPTDNSADNARALGVIIGSVVGGMFGLIFLFVGIIACNYFCIYGCKGRSRGMTISAVPMAMGGPSPIGVSGQKPTGMGDPRGGGAAAPNPYGMWDPRGGGAGAAMPAAWGDHRATEMGGGMPMLGGASPASYPVPRAYGQGPIYAGTY